MEKSVDLLDSDLILYCKLIRGTFFHKWVRDFASHQYKFHFDSMYCGLDTPYGCNNMKTAKEGSLDV